MNGVDLVSAIIALIFIFLGGLLDETQQDVQQAVKEKLQQRHSEPCPKLVESDAGRHPPIGDVVLPPDTGVERQIRIDCFQTGSGIGLSVESAMRGLHRLSDRPISPVGDQVYP